MSKPPTRLAVFSLVEWSFVTVRDWASAAGHEIALVVTQPASAFAPGVQYSTAATPDAVVMVVPRVSACEAALADLGVDLAIVFTFGRVPESVASLPRCGTVNIHPSLLPAYRGANGYRALYDGAPRIGATLHHLTPEFDAGPILAQASEATPEDVDPSTALEALQRSATAALSAGVPRALAGERGEDQDISQATGAPKFSEAETTLDIASSIHAFQCQLSALILAGIQPSVMLEGESQPLRAARRLHGVSAETPGVLSSTSASSRSEVLTSRPPPDTAAPSGSARLHSPFAQAMLPRWRSTGTTRCASSRLTQFARCPIATTRSCLWPHYARGSVSPERGLRSRRFRVASFVRVRCSARPR
jgi:methionyl-tRNA formyltransferase